MWEVRINLIESFVWKKKKDEEEEKRKKLKKKNKKKTVFILSYTLYWGKSLGKIFQFTVQHSCIHNDVLWNTLLRDNTIFHVGKIVQGLFSKSLS